MSTGGELAQAYEHCEAITRAQAANFFYGIRLLARERRRAMCAVYAFARRVDDIGDGTLAREQKLRALELEARALAAISQAPPGAGRENGRARASLPITANGASHAGDPVMVALGDTQRRFALPADALGELIEGVRMDVTGTTYESFEELVVYCRRVAGAIGRACLAIFGLRADAAGEGVRAQRLADDLGVALQLTNILRDVREDAENGRVYLPAEDLRRFGVSAAHHEPGGVTAAAQLLDALQSHSPGQAQARSAGPAEEASDRPAGPPRPGPVEPRSDAPGQRGGADAGDLDRLSALVRFECERAEQWFDRGLMLTELLDRRSAACVLAMAGIYRRLLTRIDAHPREVARRRISVPAHEKAWVAVRGMLGAGA